MPSITDQVIPVTHLFAPLDVKLIELLHGLTPDEWQMPTIARLWKVKDIASHLLDGNIKTISLSRDQYFQPPPSPIESNQDLVNFINQLNADWVKASARISPQLLIYLLEITGKEFCKQMTDADLYAKAMFSVSWAGETESVNWFHIAREYTEKWLHQQQIRHAVGKEGIMTRNFFYPLIDTLLQGLPHVYRNVEAPAGTKVKITIASEIGGDWYLEKEEKAWTISKQTKESSVAQIEIEPQIVWRLFSKGITSEEAQKTVIINGDAQYVLPVLNFVAVVG